MKLSQIVSLITILIVKLYPIINLNFLPENLSARKFSQLYWSIIDAIDNWTCRDDHIDLIEAIEFSLASPYIFENLFDIKTKLWEGDLDLALASLISIDQLLEIKKHLSYFIDERIEVFAPAFDEQIAELIEQDQWMNQYIDYIPAVYSKDDVDEIFDLCNKVPKLKVFPLNPSVGEDLLKALAAPYPELRDYQVNDGEELLISSPRDYQKLRKSFLLNPSSRKLIFKPQQREVQELIEHIKWCNPKTKIVLSGINDDLASAKSVKRVEFVATRMFKSTINKMVNASISQEEVSNLIAAEFDKYSSIST